MKDARESPISFRANEADKEIMAYLQERLGLKMPQVFRVAIRRLYEQEKRAEGKK